MTALNWLRLLLAACLLCAATEARAQERDLEGLWALQADGRVLALLDLRRNSAAEGGWEGEWIRPERISIDDRRTAFDIAGPVVRRPIGRAAIRGDRVELTVPHAEREADVFVMRLVTADAAELRLSDAPIPPLTLQRVPAGTVVAADWDPARRYALAPPPRRSNPEMADMFRADQAVRQPGSMVDQAEMTRGDRIRRQRTRLLLDAGALESGDDFYHAAFIFQHGDGPGDYLMAHTLAVIAATLGRSDAGWIAAASLDRYLLSIGRAQIYGTQQRTRGRPAAREPYDRSLIPGALREALGVPAPTEQ